jgi:antitoxin MazE
MVARVLKWGNSLGVRIPKNAAIETHINEGSELRLSVEGKSLVLTPVLPGSYRLAELLSCITDDNRHTEVVAGEPD